LRKLTVDPQLCRIADRGRHSLGVLMNVHKVWIEAPILEPNL
jgi:hypothetical protein